LGNSKTASQSWRVTFRGLLKDKPRLLTGLLCLEGAIEMLAFVAAVMPQAWMAATHRFLGLGEFPASPLLDYMIRSVSFLYGLHGILLLILATDVKRFRPLIVYAAASCILAAFAFTVIDLTNNFPWWWTLGEVGSILWLGVLLIWLLWF
jgi:hypothetical protein